MRYIAVISALNRASGFRVHFWHGVEAAAFVVVAIGVAAIADWRQRRTAPGAGKVVRPKKARGVPGVSRVSGETLLSLCCVAAIGAAGVHFTVMPEHFEESVLYGAFFLVTATAQLGWAVVTLVRPTRVLLAMGIAANAAVILLWLATRIVAIPLGPSAGETEAFGGLDILASALEGVGVLTGALLLMRPELPPRRSWMAVGHSRALLFGLAAAATAVAITASTAPPT